MSNEMTWPQMCDISMQRVDNSIEHPEDMPDMSEEDQRNTDLINYQESGVLSMLGKVHAGLAGEIDNDFLDKIEKEALQYALDQSTWSEDK